MTSTKDDGGVGLPAGCQQQLSGIRDAAADHEPARVQQRCQVGQSLTEPAADLVEAVNRGRIALLRSLRHNWPVDVRRIAMGQVEQASSIAGPFAGYLSSRSDQGAAAAVLLEAAPVAAAA